MTIGSEFRQAREERGLTLVEISKRTAIRVPALRAIERDDFQQLPGGVISRGFLKLYAREV
jgi:cytoskeletal protein RodZ